MTPRWAQDRPKRLPRRPKTTPRGSQEAPKTAQDLPIIATDSHVQLALKAGQAYMGILARVGRTDPLQDRLHRLQEQPKTSQIGPKSVPRPPT